VAKAFRTVLSVASLLSAEFAACVVAVTPLGIVVLSDGTPPALVTTKALSTIAIYPVVAEPVW